MDAQGAKQSVRYLIGHFTVDMRMVPIGARTVLGQVKDKITHGARLHDFERVVLAHWHMQALPMHAGRLTEIIAEVDDQVLAFAHIERRPRVGTVVNRGVNSSTVGQGDVFLARGQVHLDSSHCTRMIFKHHRGAQWCANDQKNYVSIRLHASAGIAITRHLRRLLSMSRRRMSHTYNTGARLIVVPARGRQHPTGEREALSRGRH